MNKSKGKTTLGDVAAAAGISRSQASRALRNHPMVAKKTCIRVQEVARKLGYKSDPMASRLMRSYRAKGEIEAGTVIAWINETEEERYWEKVPFMKAFYTGAVERAGQLGVSIEPFWLGQPGMTVRRATQILNSRGISGLIFPNPKHPVTDYSFNWSRFALVVFGGRPDLKEFSHIIVDDYANIGLLLENVMAHGYQRVGLVLNGYVDWISEQKLRARLLLYQSGIAKKDRIPILMEELGDDQKEVLLNWIHKYSPDCIIPIHGETVIWLEEAGYRVPADIGVASINVSLHTADWSGVRINQRLIGASALDAVLAQLARYETGMSSNPKRLLIRGRWQEGKTLK